MYELRDFAEPERRESGSETRTIVSFPDHYLVPYIERCKRSKLITCGWSILFLGLAIFCFFATNYMIPSYPVTVARKIVFVFAGLVSLLLMASCLNLRFRILPQCRGDPEDNVVFEIARRDDVELSNSFSAFFQVRETSLRPETPREESNEAETPGDASSQAVTIDDPCYADISTSRYSDRGRLPRHSISNAVSEDAPLLPQRRPVKLSWPSWMKNAADSIRSQIGRAVSAKTKYASNYSTFENDSDSSDTETLRPESALENGSLLPESTLKKDSDARGTESLLSESTFENESDARRTESLLSESTFESDSDAHGTESLLSESTFENGSGARGTESLPAKSRFENGSGAHRTETLPAELTFANGSDAHGTESLLVRPTFANGSYASETESLPAESTFGNGSDARETERLLAEES